MKKLNKIVSFQRTIDIFKNPKTKLNIRKF